MHTTRAIAEGYLVALAADPEKRNAGYYIRLAYKYGVPTGRVITLTQMPADVVIAHIEGGD